MLTILLPLACQHHQVYCLLGHLDVARHYLLRSVSCQVNNGSSNISILVLTVVQAIANESGINFISVKGPELLNMVV